MQWIRFIDGDQGDRLVADELLADVLFSSAIYFVFQRQHTSPLIPTSSLLGCMLATSGII